MSVNDTGIGVVDDEELVLDAARTLIAWCELRRDFRTFRIDRIMSAEFLDERYPERPAALRAKWLASVRREAAQKSKQPAG